MDYHSCCRQRRHHTPNTRVLVFNTDRLLEHILYMTQNASTDFQNYITQSMTRADLPPKITANDIMQSLLEQGLVPLNFPQYKLDSAQKQLLDMGPMQQVILVEGRSKFSQFRSLAKSVKLLRILRECGLLNDDVLEAIEGYIDTKQQDDEVVCYSHLEIIYTHNQTPQKLHRDHFADDERQEVVFAVDLSGNPLATRVFSNTHGGVKKDRSYCDTMRELIRRFPKAFPDDRPLSDLPRSIDAAERCQAMRLLSTMLTNFEADKYMTYTEVQTPGMLFDAGSFHSGGLPSLGTIRLFLTFRSKHFYDNGSGLADNDTWFADKQPHVPIRNIRNGTYKSLQQESSVSKKRRFVDL